MSDLRLCTEPINILKRQSCKGVIEIKSLELKDLKSIRSSVETVICGMIKQSEEYNLRDVLSPSVRQCRRFWSYLIYGDVPEATIARPSPEPEPALRIIRQTALLLDIALVSYIRSHGSGLHTPGLEMKSVNYNNCYQDAELLGFKCYWMQLAYLGALLDGRQVWVFQFSQLDGHEVD